MCSAIFQTDIGASSGGQAQKMMTGLAPIPMHPAYRSGSATPWGGSGLREYFGKDIPDECTGEALECSCIPGLNSTDDRGTPLSSLISTLGERLTGTAVKGEFPLLLKLLCAKDRLSVQVHPDDAYAREHENKLGKTEAWIILYAEEGASIVYGVKEGTTREQLREASEKGKEIEQLLRHVPVRAGEVYYIPAGTVHAIGSGIVLYEIQQSSDVTYRFYDWDRTDSQGRKRQLHTRDAVAVTDVTLSGLAAVPVELGPGRCRLLKNEHFTVERWDSRTGVIKKDLRRFRILTALGETRLSWEGGSMQLTAGQTVLIPADTAELTVSTVQLLLSMPSAEDD